MNDPYFNNARHGRASRQQRGFYHDRLNELSRKRLDEIIDGMVADGMDRQRALHLVEHLVREEARRTAIK